MAIFNVEFIVNKSLKQKSKILTAKHSRCCPSVLQVHNNKCPSRIKDPRILDSDPRFFSSTHPLIHSSTHPLIHSSTHPRAHRSCKYLEILGHNGLTHSRPILSSVRITFILLILYCISYTAYAYMNYIIYTIQFLCVSAVL